MKTRATAWCGTILCCLVISGTATAQTEMTGVRAMGLGEAFTGGATGTGALFYNPAGISSLMMYSIEGSYVYDQLSGRSLIHASIVDGKSNPALGGGFGYTFSTSADDAALPGFKGHDFYGALSAPLIPGLLLAGVTGHYLTYDLDGEDMASGFTLDAGLLVSLGDFVRIGVAGRDLIAVDGSGRNRQLRTGLSYSSEALYFGFDTIFDFLEPDTAVSYAGGIEVMMGQAVPIRAGYRYQGFSSQHIISGGLGWRSAVVGVDALFRQNANVKTDRMFGMALNLYL